MSTAQEVTYRSCGNCTACCKLLGIEELNKPRNVWCGHCDKGRGCGIYETKPASCTEFQCLWTVIHEGGNAIPEDFRPDKVRCVITPSLSGAELAVYVDPGTPNAWKEGKFGEYLRTLAARNVTLIINVGSRVFVMRKEKPFGSPTEKITIREGKAVQTEDGAQTHVRY